MKKQIVTISLVILLAGSMAGCGSAKKADGALDDASVKKLGSLKEYDPKEKVSIKVMYYDDRSFASQYGSTFAIKYPNIDVQVVSTNGLNKPNQNAEDYFKAQEDFIKEQKPDVILVPDVDRMAKWMEGGLLYPLDNVIKQDKFDIENIHAGVTELVKSKGKGKIYALAPQLYSQAIYYNKDLFAKNGAAVPKDQMSWDDIMQLAKKFPTGGTSDQRVYGLYMPYTNPAQFGQVLGTLRGLTFVDSTGDNVTIADKNWKTIFNLAMDGFKGGYVYTPENKQPGGGPITQEDYLKQNLFVAGRAAMALDSFYLLGNIEQAKKLNISSFEWDLVTAPVDPASPDLSPYFNVSQLFAVNAKSTNQRAAWELVKFINGDEFARASSKTGYNMPSRINYIKERDPQHHMEAFYKLKPKIMDINYLNKVPQSFFSAFYPILSNEMSAVIDGSKTVDEALQTAQQKGQEELINAKASAASAATPPPVSAVPIGK